MVKVKALVYISPIAIVLHSEKVKIKCDKYNTDLLNSFIKLYNDSGFSVKNITENTSTLYSYQSIGIVLRYLEYECVEEKFKWFFFITVE